jgi:sensor domain CHASE-containing protein
MDFSHQVIIALVVALGISQAVSFTVQARILQKIHDDSNEMRATVKTPLDAVIAILQRMNAKG